jgi:hypothetical protein
MGDWFQTIVDRDASLAEAPALGSAVRDWLIERRVIAANPADCVLGSKGIGYPPGTDFEQVLEAPEAPDRRTRELWTNGFHVTVGRTVFHAGQNGLELVCQKCGTRSDGGELWGKAVDEWYAAKGPGLLPCSTCGNPEAVTDWTYDPPWGFGNLGFNFWNWPRLKTSFVAELSRRLQHRTVVVTGKL